MQVHPHRLAIALGIALFAFLTPSARAQDTKPVSKPGASQPAAPAAGKKGEKKTSTKFKKPGDGTVNVNTASMSELQRLPGVGPAIAQRVIDKRTELGGKFTDLDQLTDVKGIGDKTLERLKPFLVLK